MTEEKQQEQCAGAPTRFVDLGSLLLPLSGIGYIEKTDSPARAEQRSLLGSTIPARAASYAVEVGYRDEEPWDELTAEFTSVAERNAAYEKIVAALRAQGSLFEIAS